MPARPAAAWTGTHLPSPLQVSGVGALGIHSFSGAGGLGQGLAMCGRPVGPQTLNRAALPLADLRLSASLSRDAATRRGRIGIPAAVDGGGVASPGCPPACTCATSASRWTARHCGSPGARPLGRPPGGPCAVYTWPPPASSPASQGPSGTPSRRLRGPRGQAAADPRVWAGRPLSTSCTLTDPEPTRARDPVPSQLRKSPPAAEGSKP